MLDGLSAWGEPYNEVDGGVRETEGAAKGFFEVAEIGGGHQVRVVDEEDEAGRAGLGLGGVTDLKGTGASGRRRMGGGGGR